MIYKFWKLKIVLLFFTTFLLYAPSTHAAFILQRPLYLGLGSGLVGNWTFDGPDMAGVTAYDRSGQSPANNGTLTGGPTRAFGAVGQALNFDGGNDRVTVADPDVLNFGTGNFTLSAWFNVRTIDNIDIDQVIYKGAHANPIAGYSIRFIDGSGQNTIQVIAGNGTSRVEATAPNNSIFANRWYHVVGVINRASTIELYLDGVSKDAADISSFSGSIDSSRPFSVGALYSEGGASDFINGLIDEVRIYNRALTASEIKRLYKIGGTTKINKPTYSGSLKNGLVGNWTFDGPDMAGVTAYDRSPVGTNHGTTTGTTRALGAVGQGLSFDGVDDYVDMGDVTALNNASAFTITAWVKDTDFSDGNRLLFKRNGDNYDIMLGPWSNDNYYIEVGNDANNTYLVLPSYSNYITQGEWYHMAMVFDGSLLGDTNRLKFFTDGVQRTLTVVTAGIPATTADLSGYPFQIAGLRSGDPSRFKGSVDEVRVYNRALSASEIKRLYKIGGTTKINKPAYSGSLKNGLVGNWTFDGPDMAGVTAYDRSGQSPANNGTLTGGPTRALGKVGQALSFDGVDDRIDTQNFMSSGVTAFTLQAWVFKTATKDSRIIYKNNAGNTGHPVFGLASGGSDLLRCRLRISDSSGTDYSAGTITLNTWTFVACTYDGSNVRAYMNGVETGYIAETGTLAATSDVVVIGQNEAGTSVDRHWPGLIDEVRVYNRALGASEIKRLYEAGR